MFKDTEVEKKQEAKLDPPKKKWTCKHYKSPCLGVDVHIGATGRVWDYEPMFCEPIEWKEE